MPEYSPSFDDLIQLSDLAENAPIGVPAAAEDTRLHDDEVMIEITPDRPCGTIRVTLAYAGRSTPIPADDPWAE